MSTGWTGDLRTGLETVDRQHREYFRRVDRLLAAYADENRPAVVSETLRFLVGYVDHHFKTEERMMTQAAYPGLEAHAERHAWFRAELRALQPRATGDAGGVVRLNALLIDWFQNHIRRVDTKMTTFLLVRAQAARTGVN